MDSSGRDVLGFSARRVQRRNGNASSADDAHTEYFEQRLHLGASDAPACAAVVKTEPCDQKGNVYAPTEEFVQRIHNGHDTPACAAVVKTEPCFVHAPTEEFVQRLHNGHGAPACAAFVKEERCFHSSSAERLERDNSNVFVDDAPFVQRFDVEDNGHGSSDASSACLEGFSSLSYPASRVASTQDVFESRAKFQVFNVFGVNVELPAACHIVSKIGKIVEVFGDFSTALVRHLQSQHHPDLLIDFVDGLLVFHMPSSSATGCLNLLNDQVTAYLQRRGKEGEISSKSSSSLFHVSGQVQRICPDFTIHDNRGYKSKVAAAHRQNRTIPQDVSIYATFEMQSYSQSEDEIREACRRQAALVDCVSVALLVKTGMVEIYDRTGLKHTDFNPWYIDVGGYSQHLEGLRLYMQPLRDAGCWNFPSQRNFRLRVNQSSLIEAIASADFQLAEEMVNYMGHTIRDRGLLPVAAEKATQQVPGALQFVKYLLDNGADIDTDTRCISTMLVAMAANDGPLIALLQQYGAPASLNTTADDLVSAVDRGDTVLIGLLIRAGCDPNHLSSDGRLALIEAIPRVPLVEAIIEAAGHLNIDKKDRSGKSARRHAKNNKAIQIVEKLESKVKLQGGGPKKSYLSKLISNPLFKKSNRNQQGEASR